MIDWCIAGWRQQSSQKAQILNWLAEARRLGFERYSLVNQGHHYWLCCCNYADADVAIYVREQIESNAAVFVQQESNQLICVAWNGDTLLGASQFPADSLGVKSLFFITQHWVSNNGMRCPLLIGGRRTRELLEAQIGNDIAVLEVSEVNLNSYSRSSKLHSIRRSPFWLRRRVVFVAISLVFASATTVSWVYWPKPVVASIAVSLPESEEIEAVGPSWSAGQLAHINKLLAEVSYLAGWEVLRWQLSENGEQLWLQSSYGSKQDLLSQLPNQSQWRWHQNGNTTYIERALPQSEPTLQNDNVTELNLERLGFVIERDDSIVTIKHSALDTTQRNVWPALINWLMHHPDSMQIVTAKAEAIGFYWSLSIEVDHKKQGSQ
ncbi:hypothetical protein LG272_10150 [Pseudidiomarina marina]|uniref:hypothetical protein n=1 Tax=Pseudidiomarina marina TaxID=502366 RepID=UPI00384A6499